MAVINQCSHLTPWVITCSRGERTRRSRRRGEGCILPYLLLQEANWPGVPTNSWWHLVRKVRDLGHVPLLPLYKAQVTASEGDFVGLSASLNGELAAHGAVKTPVPMVAETMAGLLLPGVSELIYRPTYAGMVAGLQAICEKTTPLDKSSRIKGPLSQFVFSLMGTRKVCSVVSVSAPPSSRPIKLEQSGRPYPQLQYCNP